MLPIRVLEEALNSRIGDESSFCDFHDRIITQEKEREQEKEDGPIVSSWLVADLELRHFHLFHPL